MPGLKKVTLRCRVSRGGFSGERVFRITLPKGKTYLGACPVEYCQTQAGEPFKPDQPPPGKQVDGRVSAYLVASNEETSRVSLPDGAVVDVENDEIQMSEEAPDVSLKS